MKVPATTKSLHHFKMYILWTHTLMVYVISGRYRGVAMVSARIPSENMYAPHSINEWTVGDTFLVTVQGRSFRRLQANV